MTISIEEKESSLEVIPFAVRLPASIFQGFAEPDVPPQMAVHDDTGVVGTITVMRKSVMIWFGWGILEIAGSGVSAASSGTFVLV